MDAWQTTPKGDETIKSSVEKQTYSISCLT